MATIVTHVDTLSISMWVGSVAQQACVNAWFWPYEQPFQVQEVPVRSQYEFWDAHGS